MRTLKLLSEEKILVNYCHKHLGGKNPSCYTCKYNNKCIAFMQHHQVCPAQVEYNPNTKNYNTYNK